MRMLRVGTSEDTEMDVPAGERGYQIAERLLAEAAGEPVETILKRGWPSAELPDIFDRWLDEYDPDIVFFKVNWFWYGYESLPLRFERGLGRVGKKLGETGVKVGKNPRMANSRTFQTGRRLLTRAVGGGATYFTPQEVVDVVETCMRRALAHREDILMVVRGPSGGWGHVPLRGKREQARSRARAGYITANLKAACDRMHVYYANRDRVIPKEELKERLSPAWFRQTASGHQYMGREEGAALVEAWTIAHKASTGVRDPARS